MKKILATLLVATMLVSCMAFISFAATPVVSTIAEYPYAAMSTFDESAWDAMDPIAVKYLATYRTITGKNVPQANATPIFKAVNATSGYFNQGTGAMGVMPTAATPDDLVYIPVNVDGAGTEQIGVKASYDANYLTPVVDLTNTGATVCEISNGALVASSLNANPVSGTHFYLIFKINADAKGDPGLTTATTTVKLNVVENAKFTIGNQTTAVKLSGLVEGEEEEADPTPITQTEVSAMTAAATTATIAEGSTLSSVLGANVVSDNGDTDISKATAYSAVFATINLTGKDTEGVEFGFILRDKNGVAADRFFKAEKEYGGKYGVAFFGTSEVLGWYKAVPAVKLANGSILENASAAQDL